MKQNQASDCFNLDLCETKPNSKHLKPFYTINVGGKKYKYDITATKPHYKQIKWTIGT